MVTKNLPIDITKNALEALSAAKSVYKDLPYIRVGIKGGAGCAGVSYSIGIDKSNEKDELYTHENLDFAIEKGQLMHLVGLQIDYVVDGNDKGFIFNNNA